MATTAVLGVAGFSGQETLDRVLAHPELELVVLGSDSLAGQPASALDPRLSRNGHGSRIKDHAFRVSIEDERPDRARWSFIVHGGVGGVHAGTVW